LPYTDRFNDLYTETKVIAERFVLSQNGIDGLLTCAIRPSGIWGCGDQTMFRKVFESVLAGHVKVLVGSKAARLDNSYVHNLIHGFILAAEHLVPGGAAVRAAMSGWQRLHFRFGLPRPPLEPLAVERLYLDNYFSVAKASRDLGYRPLFTTEQATVECLPYYTELFDQMKAAAPPQTRRPRRRSKVGIEPAAPVAARPAEATR
jgi:3beta-hydroxy-delta5-steroid dehydrogenase/steroid delta-isomerase